MKTKIEHLKIIARNLDVMICILEGEFYKKYLSGNGTVKEQISCYHAEGEDYTDVFEKIIKEHGDEQCPHNGEDI